MNNLIIELDEVIDYLNGISNEPKKLILLTKRTIVEHEYHYVLALGVGENDGTAEIKATISEPIVTTLEEAKHNAARKMLIEMLIPYYYENVK